MMAYARKYSCSKDWIAIKKDSRKIGITKEVYSG
jgi:hypothetical protein